MFCNKETVGSKTLSPPPIGVVRCWILYIHQEPKHKRLQPKTHILFMFAASSHRLIVQRWRGTEC